MKQLTVLLRAPVAIPAALLVGSAAMAAPIGGYDAWTVNNGSITATCPAGHTCTNLDAVGNGILQQKVVDSGDTTLSYFRTIITDEGATATDLASVQALGFRNEGMVQTLSNANNYSIRGVIKAGAELGNDQIATSGEVSSGALLAGSANDVVLDQEQGLGATTRRMDWHFDENGGNDYLELNAYSTGGVAGGGAGNEGAITVRRTLQTGAGGTLTLGTNTLAYAAGDNVTAVWLTQAASGVGDFTNRTLVQQRYTVVSPGGPGFSAASNNVGGTSIQLSNADGAGNFVITLNGASAEISPNTTSTSWGWDTNVFGTRPVSYYTNTGSTGVLAPPTGTFANDYVIP